VRQSFAQLLDTELTHGTPGLLDERHRIDIPAASCRLHGTIATGEGSYAARRDSSTILNTDAPVTAAREAAAQAVAGIGRRIQPDPGGRISLHDPRR
jgi:hypothetical protein